MRFAYICGAGLSLALCGQTSSCNEAVAVQTACTVVEAAAVTPSIKLNTNQQATLNAALAACKATQDGTSLTAQADTVAILSAAALIQPMLSGVKISALMPEEAARIKEMQISMEALQKMARDAGLVRP